MKTGIVSAALVAERGSLCASDYLSRVDMLKEEICSGEENALNLRRQLRIALGKLFVLRKDFGEDFDGDFTPELGVLCLVHLPHTPDPEEGNNFIGAQSCAGFECHVGPLT